MGSKKRYYFIGFLLLLGAVIGYHFYAASQAEQQIDKAIQEQTAGDSISVQYSAIDVTPFGGTVSIADLTVVLGNHIERAQHLKLHMSYLDFLNIYFGGMHYGLKNLQKASVTILNASYVNQSGLEELKLGELTINYRGNALDGLVSAINGTAFTYEHAVEAESSDLIINLPQTTLSKVTAEKFRYSGSVDDGGNNFWTNGSHQFGMDSLSWTPSQNFQNTYSFFIKGFGYDTDAIPFKSAHLHTKPAEQDSLLTIESSVDSDLALFTGSGLIQLHNRLGRSELKEVTLSATRLSPSFQRVLSNVERLFSIQLPRSENSISIQLKGTLSNPSIAP